jgi:hypothetical protein
MNQWLQCNSLKALAFTNRYLSYAGSAISFPELRIGRINLRQLQVSLAPAWVLLWCLHRCATYDWLEWSIAHFPIFRANYRSLRLSIGSRNRRRLLFRLLKRSNGRFAPNRRSSSSVISITYLFASLIYWLLSAPNVIEFFCQPRTGRRHCQRSSIPTMVRPSGRWQK